MKLNCAGLKDKIQRKSVIKLTPQWLLLPGFIYFFDIKDKIIVDQYKDKIQNYGQEKNKVTTLGFVVLSIFIFIISNYSAPQPTIRAIPGHLSLLDRQVPAVHQMYKLLHGCQVCIFSLLMSNV